MTPDWSRIWELAKPILMLLVGGLVTSFLERRPRLIKYVVHPSAVVIQPPNGQKTRVHVHALVVKNNGRKPANNVRLGHNILPDFSVHPNVQYRVEDLPGGGKEIIFPVLVAGADVLVQYLYFPPLIWNGVNTHVFSDEGRAKAINVWQVRQFPSGFYGVLYALIFLGTVTTVYLVWVLASLVPILTHARAQ